MSVMNRRSKNDPSFAGLPKAENSDNCLQYWKQKKRNTPGEYDLFVKGVSYAAEGEVPDFTAAVTAVEALVQKT